MICRTCNDLMRYVRGAQNGGYYSCPKCGNVVITGEKKTELPNDK